MDTFTERYAGFWIRVGASLIDLVILCAPFLGISWLSHTGVFDPSFHFHHVRGQPQPHLSLPKDIVPWGLTLLISISYEVGTTASSLQGTLGKNCCGIKVVDYQGQTLSLFRSFGRYAAKSVWSVLQPVAQSLTLTTEGLKWISLIDCLVVAFMPKKQALHDYVAKTLVGLPRQRNAWF